MCDELWRLMMAMNNGGGGAPSRLDPRVLPGSPHSRGHGRSFTIDCNCLKSTAVHQDLVLACYSTNQGISVDLTSWSTFDFKQTF